MQIEHSGRDGGPIELEARRPDFKKLIADPEAFAALERIEEALNGKKPVT